MGRVLVFSNHRIQNLFAVIQSVALHSLGGNRSLVAAREVFIDRLQSLGRAYTMMGEQEWQGAPLRQILAAETSAKPTVVRGGDQADSRPIPPRPRPHEMSANDLLPGDRYRGPLDEFEAFDVLPRAIRRALDAALFQWSAADCLERLARGETSEWPY